MNLSRLIAACFFAALAALGLGAIDGVARGPMAPVVDNLASVSDQDVKTIAIYVASVMGEPTPARRRRGEYLIGLENSSGNGTKPQSGGSQTVSPPKTSDAGAAIYASACASCRESGRPVPYGGINLSLSTVINAPSSRNLLNLLLVGLPAADGVRGPIMPAFAATLTDPQIDALAGYPRSNFSKQPVWSNIATQLQEARTSQLGSNFSSEARFHPPLPANRISHDGIDGQRPDA